MSLARSLSHTHTHNTSRPLLARTEKLQNRNCTINNTNWATPKTTTSNNNQRIVFIITFVLCAPYTTGCDRWAAACVCVNCVAAASFNIFRSICVRFMRWWSACESSGSDLDIETATLGERNANRWPFFLRRLRSTRLCACLPVRVCLIQVGTHKPDRYIFFSRVTLLLGQIVLNSAFDTKTKVYAYVTASVKEKTVKWQWCD